ncbi:MAG TPA: hypothetical protein VH186_02640 [Chloroflexia bacterium]|nr:hypothetical protein [Chloroflexia bacterium]
MLKFGRQFIDIIRKLLGLDINSNNNRHGHDYFRLDLWNGRGRLAESPNIPGSSAGNRVGSYAGQSSQSKRHKYSAQEVKRILRGLDKGPLAQPVMAQAAIFSNLLDDRMIRYFRGRERLFDKLPFVLFQYTQGKPCADIARSVSYFADAEDVEEAIDFASGLIAHQVNRQH